MTNEIKEYQKEFIYRVSNRGSKTYHLLSLDQIKNKQDTIFLMITKYDVKELMIDAQYLMQVPDALAIMNVVKGPDYTYPVPQGSSSHVNHQTLDDTFVTNIKSDIQPDFYTSSKEISGSGEFIQLNKDQYTMFTYKAEDEIKIKKFDFVMFSFFTDYEGLVKIEYTIDYVTDMLNFETNRVRILSGIQTWVSNKNEDDLYGFINHNTIRYPDDIILEKGSYLVYGIKLSYENILNTFNILINDSNYKFKLNKPSTIQLLVSGVPQIQTLMTLSVTKSGTIGFAEIRLHAVGDYEVDYIILIPNNGVFMSRELGGQFKITIPRTGNYLVGMSWSFSTKTNPAETSSTWSNVEMKTKSELLENFIDGKVESLIFENMIYTNRKSVDISRLELLRDIQEYVRVSYDIIDLTGKIDIVEYYGYVESDISKYCTFDIYEMSFSGDDYMDSNMIAGIRLTKELDESSKQKTLKYFYDNEGINVDKLKDIIGTMEKKYDLL